MSESSSSHPTLTSKTIEDHRDPAASSPAPDEFTARLSSAFKERYRLERPLGAGGMGVVYLARHVGLDRAVAIKFPTMASDLRRDRFVREGKLLARLNHPNLVQVHDAGRDGDQHYMVCELVDGKDLRTVISDDGLPIGEAVAIVLQLLAGLAEAHRNGILHRDVKSENLLINQQGVAKLADFGLAYSEDSSSATLSGTVMGTPAYMSPEQARGLPLDERSDVYSAAIVLHEALTGKLPFVSKDMHELLRMQVIEPPPDIRGLRPEVSPSLAAALGAALAKSPLERPASAAAFAQLLRSALTPTELEMGNRLYSGIGLSKPESPPPVPQPPPGFVMKFTLRRLGLCTGIALLSGLASITLLSPLDRAGYDVLLRNHPPAKGTGPVQCLLVRNWPCKRSELASAIRRLHGAGARAIGLDISLDRIIPGDPYRDGAESQQLAAALNECPGVVVAIQRGGDGNFLHPLPSFGEAFDSGNAHFVLDPDGIIRRARLRSMEGDRRIWAFAFKLAQRYWRIPDLKLPREPLSDRFSIGGRPVHLEHGSLMIRFRPPRPPAETSGAGSLRTVTGGIWLEDWLEAGPAADKILFGDKVVLLGAHGGGSADSFRTSVDLEDSTTPGVLVHAEVVRTLLRGDAPAFLPDAMLGLVLLVVALALSVLALTFPPWFAGLLGLAAFAAHYTFVFPRIFATHGLVLPLGAILGVVLGSWVTGPWLRGHGGDPRR